MTVTIGRWELLAALGGVAAAWLLRAAGDAGGWVPQRQRARRHATTPAVTPVNEEIDP